MKKRAFDALKNIAYAAKETLCIGTEREREREKLRGFGFFC